MSGIIDTNRIQYVAIIGSILFLLFVIELIRKKKLKEAFSLLWLGLSIVFIVLSFWREGLEVIAGIVGIDYAPSALFLFLLVGLIFIVIQFSVIMSKLSEQNNNLTQEVGLLRLEIENLKRKYLPGNSGTDNVESNADVNEKQSGVSI